MTADNGVDFNPTEPAALTLVSIVGAIHDRARAAPLGPWHVWDYNANACPLITRVPRSSVLDDPPPDVDVVLEPSEWMVQDGTDAKPTLDFIAASRSDVPALAHALILMRQQIEVMIRRMWGDWKSIEFGGAVLTVDEAVERELARIDREIQKAVWPETLKNETGGT